MTTPAPAPFYTRLPQFALIEFSGADAAAFLQGQLSCDVAALEPGQAGYGSYSTPKGRMLASFLLWRTTDAFCMQLPAPLAEATRKRLAMYVLRSKVRIAEPALVLSGIVGRAAAAAAWGPALPAADLRLAAVEAGLLLRLDAERYEFISPAPPAGLPAPEGRPVDWDLLEIRAGIPWVLPGTREQFVPQYANLDLIGGISYSKGCYPGQEIVARTHYLGRLKQRMYRAVLEGADAPAPGDALYSGAYGDQASGMVVNAAPAPGGGHELLVVAHIESAAQNDLRWGAPDGPRLQLETLPYEVKTDIKAAG